MMSCIPLVEIVDSRYLKIDFKNYVYYIVLVLIFYTPGYVDLEMKKKFESYERGSPPTGESPRPSEMENEIDFRFHFP